MESLIDLYETVEQLPTKTLWMNCVCLALNNLQPYLQ